MTTTIKVDDAVRDRLKAQAARRGLTLGAHLQQLADLHDRHDRLARLAAAIAATPDDQARSYAAESELWESAELHDARR